MDKFENLEPIKVMHVMSTLTFDETELVEDLTGYGLSTLQERKQAKLSRAIVIVGAKRQGINIGWKSLGEMDPNDFIDSAEEMPEDEEENPTDASD